jgi:hypothetical protein
MDQASTWTPADVGGAHQFEIDFNRDQRLGDAIGGLASVGPFLFPSGVSLASSASGWTSASDGYYDATGQVQVRPGASSDLAALNCGPEFDVSYLPFGANTIRNISVTGGCGYRFRSSSLEQWRLEARYRFARQKLDTLNVPERAYDDHGFESAILREFSMESGFDPDL